MAPWPCLRLPCNVTALLRLAQGWCVGRRRPRPCSGLAAATACLLCCTASPRCAGVSITQKHTSVETDPALHELAAGCADPGPPVHTGPVTSAPLSSAARSCLQLWQSPAVGTLFLAWSLAEVWGQSETSGYCFGLSIVHCVSVSRQRSCLHLVQQVVRYPWYAASLAGGAPGWLTWARYSAFLPLYPVGVASEMWLLFSGLPAARGRRLHSVALPNTWNFAFDYSYFLVVGGIEAGGGFDIVCTVPAAQVPWYQCWLLCAVEVCGVGVQ